MNLVISVLVIGSCTKADMTDGLIPVEFMKESVVVTRGADQSKSFLSGDAFGVMAYYVPPAVENAVYMASAKPDFMYNTKVSYDGNLWSYAPVMYWPQKDGASVNFYAYFPSSSIPGENGITISPSDRVGYPSFDFELNESANVDLLVAEAKECTAEDGSVALNFRHLLSKVQFRFKVSNEDGFSYVVNQIKIMDVPQTGTYAWPDEGITFNSSPVINVLAGDGGEDHLVDTTNPILIEDFTVYLPPGELGQIEILLNNEAPQTLDYSGLTLIPGKMLTITIEIGLTGIQFTTTVTNWVNGGKASGNIS